MEDKIIKLLSNSTSADLLVQLEALWGSKGSSKPEASSVQGIKSLFLRLEQVRVSPCTHDITKLHVDVSFPM